MLKGINKQVIEVVDTGSVYFERAILIVNPRVPADQNAIIGEAARMFGEQKTAVCRRPRRIFAWCCVLAGVFLLGCLAALLALKLLG